MSKATQRRECKLVQQLRELALNNTAHFKQAVHKDWYTQIA